MPYEWVEKDPLLHIKGGTNSMFIDNKPYYIPTLST